MEILETSFFTKQINELLTDEDYMLLQRALVINPLRGAVIPGGGGLRKIRWRIDGKGKSGGIRIIYYYVSSDNRVFMVHAYAKGVKDDLTKKELAILRKLMKAGRSS